MTPFKYHGENCPVKRSFQNQDQTNSIQGCKILPNCTILKKPQSPQFHNEIPGTGKTPSEGLKDPQCQTLNSEYWERSTVLRYYVNLPCLKTMNLFKNRFQVMPRLSCSNKDMAIHSNKSNSIQTLYVTEVKFIT